MPTNLESNGDSCDDGYGDDDKMPDRIYLIPKRIFALVWDTTCVDALDGTATIVKTVDKARIKLKTNFKVPSCNYVPFGSRFSIFLP